MTTLRSHSDFPLSPPPIPSPRHAQVWVDFDGTITRQDVLDQLILTFAANGSWRKIEEQFQKGEIGSYECLKQEFAALDVREAQIEPFLANIQMDDGLPGLLAMLLKHQVPVAIVSDGVDRFIHSVLARLEPQLRPPPPRVRCNSVAFEPDGSLRLLCPNRDPECTTDAAHCKCASLIVLGESERHSIYIGDGRSDLCPARRCPIVFAKGNLARHLTTEGRAFYPFDSLRDVQTILEKSWQLV